MNSIRRLIVAAVISCLTYMDALARPADPTHADLANRSAQPNGPRGRPETAPAETNQVSCMGFERAFEDYKTLDPKRATYEEDLAEASERTMKVCPNPALAKPPLQQPGGS